MSNVNVKCQCQSNFSERRSTDPTSTQKIYSIDCNPRKYVTKFLIDFGGDIDHIKAGELGVPEELDERCVALIQVDALVCVPACR